MYVSELIVQLQEFVESHGDAKLIASIDDEGNGYRYLHGVDDVLVESGQYIMENVYDSVEEAVEEWDANEDSLIKVALLY